MKTFRTIATILALATVSALFANEGEVATNSCYKQCNPPPKVCSCKKTCPPTVPIDKGHPLVTNLYGPAYNASGRIDVNGCSDFYAQASYIFWQPSEEGLELGLLYFTDPVNHRGRVLNSDFPYKSGFKVGAGYGFEHDYWTIDGQYTRLHSQHKSSEGLPTTDDNFDYVEAVWFDEGQLTTATELSSKWSLYFDLLDITLGRPYYCGKNLIFKPRFGIRGYWITQKLLAKYTLEEAAVPSNNKSKSWALGLKAGLDGHWLFCDAFRLFGNVGGSLAYQHLKARSKKWSFAQDEFSVDWYMRNKHGTITPSLESSVGLGWGTYFCNKGFHIDLSVAYEFLYFFNQNEMRKLVDEITDLVNGSPGDLRLHGLSITLRLDF